MLPIALTEQDSTVVISDLTGLCYHSRLKRYQMAIECRARTDE